MFGKEFVLDAVVEREIADGNRAFSGQVRRNLRRADPLMTDQDTRIRSGPNTGWTLDLRVDELLTHWGKQPPQ